jgi:DNA-binding Xre family transcriptional regulator
LYIYKHYIKGVDILKLSKKLKEIRVKKGLSKYELAKRTGLSDSTILRLETGEMDNPALKTLLAICKELDITINELIY